MRHSRSDDPAVYSANDAFQEPERFAPPPPRGAGWRISHQRVRAYIASQWHDVSTDMVNDLTGEVRVLWPMATAGSSLVPSHYHQVVDVAHVMSTTMGR